MAHHKFVLLLVVALMLSCQLTGVNPNPTIGKDVFRIYLNLTPSSDDVRNISVESSSTETILTTSILLRYLGNESYMTTLLNHDSFLEISEFNSKFRATDCDSSQFPSEFSFWTDAIVDTQNKDCYIGVFFPYIHYLVRNPANEEIEHFIAGMRE